MQEYITYFVWLAASISLTVAIVGSMIKDAVRAYQASQHLKLMRGE